MNIRDAAWGEAKAALAVLNSAVRLIQDDQAKASSNHIGEEAARAAVAALRIAEKEVIEALRTLA